MLNPTHSSEAPLQQSYYGRLLHATKFQGPITVLPHESLKNPGLVGDVKTPIVIVPSVFYLSERYGGPVPLGPKKE